MDKTCERKKTNEHLNNEIKAQKTAGNEEHWMWNTYWYESWILRTTEHGIDSLKLRNLDKKHGISNLPLYKGIFVFFIDLVFFNRLFIYLTLFYFFLTRCILILTTHYQWKSTITIFFLFIGDRKVFFISFFHYQFGNYKLEPFKKNQIPMAIWQNIVTWISLQLHFAW